MAEDTIHPERIWSPRVLGARPEHLSIYWRIENFNDANFNDGSAIIAIRDHGSRRSGKEVGSGDRKKKKEKKKGKKKLAARPGQTAIQHPDISWDQNLRQLRLGALIQQRAPSNAVIPRKRNSIAISHPILAVSEKPPSSILRFPPSLTPSPSVSLRRPTSFNPYRSITSSLFPPLCLYQYRPNLLCRQIVFAFPRQCNPLETTLILSSFTIVALDLFTTSPRFKASLVRPAIHPRARKTRSSRVRSNQFGLFRDCFRKREQFSTSRKTAASGSKESNLGHEIEVKRSNELIVR